jgi:hypothetical protein
MEPTTNPDEYQGCKNRETWAAAFWLNNTRELYDAARELAADCRRECVTWAAEMRAKYPDAPADAFDIESAAANTFESKLDLAELAELLTDPRDGTPASMLEDIGSKWRVDGREVYRSFAEGLAEEVPA